MTRIVAAEKYGRKPAYYEWSRLRVSNTKDTSRWMIPRRSCIL